MIKDAKIMATRTRKTVSGARFVYLCLNLQKVNTNIILPISVSGPKTVNQL